MNTQQKIRSELWRADIYRLLALGLDTPSQKNCLHLEGLLADLNSIEDVDFFLEDIRQLYETLKEEKEELIQEYHRLFVTKSECPVSEGSYHLAERGPILGDVTAFYKAFRIQFHSESGPPDSIKMELGFMHYLALKKIYALEHKLREAFQTTEDAEKKFLSDHLGRWALPFAKRLKETTQRLFYKVLSSLLQSWIKEECSRFQITPVPLPTSLLPIGSENCMRCAHHQGGEIK